VSVAPGPRSASSRQRFRSFTEPAHRRHPTGAPRADLTAARASGEVRPPPSHKMCPDPFLLHLDFGRDRFVHQRQNGQMQGRPGYCQAIQNGAFRHGKMVFVSGPRQVGKTTLAKLLSRDCRDQTRFHGSAVTSSVTQNGRGVAHRMAPLAMRRSGYALRKAASPEAAPRDGFAVSLISKGYSTPSHSSSRSTSAPFCKDNRDGPTILVPMLILVVTVLYIGDKTVRCRIVRDIAKPSDKEKREVDFLITSNRKPWLLAECKLSDKSPAPALAYFARVLRPAMTVQVIAAPGVHDSFDIDGAPAYVVSADRFLRLLP